MASEELRIYLKNNCQGRKNAKKGAELERVFHISENELRRQVNRLRKKKIPICSGSKGYFYAAHAGEVYTTILNLQDMREGMQDSINGLLGSLEHFGETDTGGDAP